MLQVRVIRRFFKSRIYRNRLVIFSLMAMVTICIYRTSTWSFTTKMPSKLEISKNVNVTITTMIPVKHQTLLYEPTFLMSPSQICSDKALNMIVYVHSATQYLHKRLAIRETWGSKDNLNKYNAKIVFVIGTSDNSVISENLKMESERFGDLIQANFHDSYKNLTLKAISAITWISKYCKNVTYVLKTDDDTFAHLERLQKYIIDLKNNSRTVTDLLACKFYTHSKPYRNKTSKFYISKKEYPMDKFPQYCQGMAYLMSSDVVHKLNNGIRNPSKNQPFVWLDEVYITGVIFKNVNLKHTHFEMAFRNHADFKLLKAHESLVFFQTNEMKSLWKTLKQIPLKS